MFGILKEELLLTVLMIVFLILGILARVVLGLLYQHMIRETDNMSATGNQQLRQCKLKFSNCFQLNHGVANIPVFVDKFLNRLAIGRISFRTIYHLSGQLVLVSAGCAGVGACKSILLGRDISELIPCYFAGFFSVVIFFSISSVLDIDGKRNILKTNLVDYLENHLSARIDVTDRDIQMLYGSEWIQRQRNNAAETLKKNPERRSVQQRHPEKIRGEERDVKASSGFTGEQEKELEELLMEFLLS
jgi:hypothetical protein